MSIGLGLLVLLGAGIEPPPLAAGDTLPSPRPSLIPSGRAGVLPPPGPGFRFTPLPVVITSTYRSRYPGRDLEGPLWAGRGWSGMLEAGMAASRGRVSMAHRPQVAWSRNRDFEVARAFVPGFTPFTYPWHPTQIDWPLRHGTSEVTELHVGESYLRVHLGPVATGISTERLHWGPARRNPVILGMGGPGFPHLFLGSSTPRNIPGGVLEGELVWGRVSESDHFFEDPQNRHRLFGGVMLQFRPGGSETLEVGITHAHVENLDPLSFHGVSFLVNPFVPRDRELGRLDRLQLGSLFLRYAIPEVGTEIYGEWGRRDLWADLLRLDAFTRGDAGFTFGFEHVRGEPARELRIHGEFTSLRTTRALGDGGRPRTFYVHSRVRHGFTHRGRVLGAPIGPGSDAQALGVDLGLGGRGRVGLLLERVRRDDDAYFRTWAPFLGFRGHDVEHTLALPFSVRWRDLEAEGTVARSWRRNRNFTGHFRGLHTDDVLREKNGTLHLRLRWRP